MSGWSILFSTKRQLPTAWKWTMLGGVCDFLDSRRIPVNNGERERRIAGKDKSDLYPYYGANGQVGWIDNYIFDEPLILLAEDGGFFGSTTKPIAYIVSGRCWVNNHAHVLKPHPDVCFEYILHALRIRPDVLDMVSGSTRAKLNQQIASRISIPLPPLPEQKRIAAILNEQMSQVDKARAAAEAQLEAAKALPDVYLRQVFPKPDQPLPEGWQWVPFKEATGRVNTQTRKLKTSEYKCSGQYPIVDQGQREIVGYTDDRSCIIYEPLPLVVFGDHTKVAKHVDYPFAIGADGVVLLSSRNGVDSRFLFYWLRQIYIRHLGYARHYSVLKSKTIPLPPLPEQKRIAASLNEKMAEVDKLRVALEKQLAEISAMPATILRKAFSGGL